MKKTEEIDLELANFKKYKIIKLAKSLEMYDAIEADIPPQLKKSFDVFKKTTQVLIMEIHESSQLTNPLKRRYKKVTKENEKFLKRVMDLLYEK